MDDIQTTVDFINGVLMECSNLTRAEFACIMDQQQYLKLEKDCHDGMRQVSGILYQINEVCQSLAKVNADAKGVK